MVTIDSPPPLSCPTLSSLERNIVEETHSRVTKHFETLFQEGIEQVRECTRETLLEVLESLGEPHNY